MTGEPVIGTLLTEDILGLDPYLADIELDRDGILRRFDSDPQAARLGVETLPALLYPWAYAAVFAATNMLIFRWYLAPPLPPASPDWSPVRTYGGHHTPAKIAGAAGGATMAAAATGSCALHGHGHGHGHAHSHSGAALPRNPFWGPAGCGCFAF